MEQSPLQSLEDKLQQLLQRFQLLQKEIKKLKDQLLQSDTLVAQSKKKIEALQQQNDALKVGIQHYSADDKKILQHRIDGYLKEIDKCLTLLDA